jgi:hypothetical protein
VTAATTLLDISQNHNSVYNMAYGDVNGDGLSDIVVSGWNIDSATAYVYLFTQNANGTLTDSTAQLGGNVIAGSQRAFIADFDNDGRNDIFLPGFRDGTSTQPANSVMFWNTGNGFTRATLPEQVMAHGACVADLNRDGLTDMIVGGGGVYFNNGNRSFSLDTTILSNNYFAACAVIQEATRTSVYLSNNSVVSRDNIAVFDSNFNLLQYDSVSIPANTDTVNVVAMDVTGDAKLDFVTNGNGVNTGSPYRGLMAWVGTATFASVAAFDTRENDYYTYELTVDGTPAIFFAASHDQASVYKVNAGVFTPYKQTSWNTNSSTNAVYQNATTGKIFMLQLINNVFKTQEM